MKFCLRGPSVQMLLLLTGLFCGAACPAYADGNILMRLVGEWHSDSDAFGQPARSTAVWSPSLGRGLFRLDYTVTYTQTAGEQPVFAGVAYYRVVQAGSYSGFWADSGGELHQLSGRQAERSLEAIWGSVEGKFGRTRYDLIDHDHMRITDWVMRDGQWQRFNQATYVRQETNSRPTNGDEHMQKVAGIGGVFFRAANTSQVAQWYADNLGVDPTPTDYETPPWQQQAGPTVFAPFAKTTDYFGRSEQQWMINFRVSDLDAMVQQLRDNGNEVEVDPEVYPNGRFARTHDPEGTPVELWEPAD